MTLFRGYSEKNIPADVELCVIGNVICRGNPEAETILNQGLEYCSMAEALYRFFIAGHTSIVVAGSHGKTTIASFAAHLLQRAELQPGFFIGGKPLNFAANQQPAAGSYFISEGDEYDTAFFDRSPKFLKYRPRLLILSALEHDHLDLYPEERQYLKVFRDLVDLVPANGLIILNRDFPLGLKAVERSLAPVLTYGEGEAALRVSAVQRENDGYAFTLQRDGRPFHFRTHLPGRYQILNLCAGIALGLHLGITETRIAEAVESFRGVERRLALIQRAGRTVFIEDFAHHPTAIAWTLESLREFYPGQRLLAVWEPRSWSLRRNFFQSRLPASFAAADEVAIMDVFEKEKIPPGERLDVAALRTELKTRGKEVSFFADYDALKQFLAGLDLCQPRVVALLSNGSFGGIPQFVRTLS